jgi:multisubunit Na+/H+ antiporter MnhC subunit
MPMNKTLCLLILLVSISSQADTLTGVVVGSMIAHNNQPEVQAAPKDHFTMILESIDKTLADRKENTENSDQLLINTAGFNGAELESLYSAKGYDVKLVGTQLVFNGANLNKEAKEKQQAWEKENDSARTQVLVLGAIILGFLIYAFVATNKMIKERSPQDVFKDELIKKNLRS